MKAGSPVRTRRQRGAGGNQVQGKNLLYADPRLRRGFCSFPGA